MTHLVVIADVIASRQLPDRAAVQRRLRRSLDARNAAHTEGDLLSPYTLTLGDEFQAVPARGQGLFHDLLQVAADLAPAQFRFALGLGDIDTAINAQQAIGMDGSAFHSARGGIQRLKDEGGHCRVDGLAGVTAELVNHGLTLAFGRLAGTRGSRLPLAAGLLDDEPIADIAARLERTEQTLYKTVRTADLHALVGFLHAVEALLDERLGAAAGT
jgi:hypothetical protein